MRRFLGGTLLRGRSLQAFPKIRVFVEPVAGVGTASHVIHKIDLDVIFDIVFEANVCHIFFRRIDIEI